MDGINRISKIMLFTAIISAAGNDEQMLTFLENFGNLETVYKGNPTKTKWVYMTFSENFKNFWYI